MFEGNIQFSNKETFERMDKVVRNTLHSFEVDTLNFYSLDNTILYSFDSDLIGRKNFGGTGYQQALNGKITSKMVNKSSLIKFAS